jgi:hypothetical protein
VNAGLPDMFEKNDPAGKREMQFFVNFVSPSIPSNIKGQLSIAGLPLRRVSAVSAL